MNINVFHYLTQINYFQFESILHLHLFAVRLVYVVLAAQPAVAPQPAAPDAAPVTPPQAPAPQAAPTAAPAPAAPRPTEADDLSLDALGVADRLGLEGPGEEVGPTR
ncbi:hypothetical protein [uncultured Microbacterium sp.]|uniref:hypothetical protein n=1 Tax=uncultured Microbacterium sp. TaxID=191216 RepID=UPI0032B26D40